jgi:hypothetical protein
MSCKLIYINLEENKPGSGSDLDTFGSMTLDKLIDLA